MKEIDDNDLKCFNNVMREDQSSTGPWLRFRTNLPRLWQSFPATQLGENLLHLPQDVSKRWSLPDPHSIRTKAETKPPGAVEGVLLVPAESIVVESIFIIIVVIIIIMSHGTEEGVPDT